MPSPTTPNDAYGETVDGWTAQSGSIDVPWRFQGRILESAAGSTDLYDFAARSYDPALGAFTSFDSVAGSAQNPLTLNRYLYASANPATLVDPDGHTAGYVCADNAHWCGDWPPPMGSTCLSTNTCNIDPDAAARAAAAAAKAAADKAAAAAAAAKAAADKVAADKAYADAHRDCGFMGMGCISIDPAKALGDAGKLVGANASSIAHAGLGVATFVPGVGTVAALADSGLYAAQGDYVDAGLSLMGVIPGGELLGKAGEALHGAAEVAEVGADVVKAGEQAEHVVTTGEKIEQGVTEGEKALDGAEAVESDASNAEDFASCPTHSFSSDTQVATPGGSEAISSLKVGDQVQAYDPKTGVTGPHHPKALSWRGVGSESCRRRR
jgi:RHS repeat-associated protein